MVYPEKPKKSDYIIEPIRTNVTREDRAEAVRDECGVLYSPDGKRLIKGNTSLIVYTVKPGTLVICNGAFDRNPLESINIPDTVTTIGDFAFSDCDLLRSIHIPETVTTIGDWAFLGCDLLESISISDKASSNFLERCDLPSHCKVIRRKS